MIRFYNPANSRESRKGFTLIEMMIVLLVVSILLAIAIPAYMRIRESSKARMCQTNLRHIQDAKDRWAMENRKRETEEPIMSELVPDYLKILPHCPSSGKYTIGRVMDDPKCDAPGDHTLD